MAELKPCPFCGGGQNSHEDWCFILMCLVNEEQAMFGYKRLFTEDDLSNAWNIRVERTCKNVSEYGSNIGGERDWNGDGFEFECSECGAVLNGDEFGESPMNPQQCTFVPTAIKYCPNCGAKVVK